MYQDKLRGEMMKLYITQPGLELTFNFLPCDTNFSNRNPEMLSQIQHVYIKRPERENQMFIIYANLKKIQSRVSECLGLNV